MVEDYKALVAEEIGKPFPQDPHDQLWGAIGAVFGSWMNPRANTYRRLHDIPASWGTAVNVQAMVYGNMGNDCATGVCFTRDPSTGENMFYGEYLVNAQGEDVVAGIRTPQPLSASVAKPGEIPLEKALPDAYAELLKVRATLEAHYKDMQDIEFTVQQNKLYMLQTRNGKRTAQASLRMAVEMAHEGLIDKAEAVMRVNPSSLDQLLHPTLDPKAPRTLFGKGLPASPGAASGSVVFSADEAESRAGKGEAVILVRVETSPEDIHGMHAAQGILTTRGGMTSHAAVVARGMGRPCVAGAGGISVDYNTSALGRRQDGARGRDHHPRRRHRRSLRRPGRHDRADRVRRFRHPDGMGRHLSPHGRARQCGNPAGRRNRAQVRRRRHRPVPHRAYVLQPGAHPRGPADDHAHMTKPAAAPPWRACCRSSAKISGSSSPSWRRCRSRSACSIRRCTNSCRTRDQEMQEVANSLGTDIDTIRRRAAELAEANPMLGHRGCRLGVTFPEIYEMQVRAIFEGAVEVAKETGKAPHPEIMIPLVGMMKELELTHAQVDKVAAEVFAESGTKVEYTVGTMIELPRAAILADQIAEVADFFSFGTNDLTQTVFGLSRDDAGKFLPHYVDAGILPKDPFVSIDVEGVGELVRFAAEKGRATKTDLKLGICGEHGGDPASIAFCEKVGLNYVSCSPFRVPVARLAAAQAALGAASDRTA